MNTSTFTIEILAPIHEVWHAISTTEGMKTWGGSIKIETDWQANSPIVITCYDDKGEIAEHNGEKMIFNGIIEVKKENKEITYSYPKKVLGLEKESYVLDEIDANTTRITFMQTYISENKDAWDGQKELMEMLKKKLEEK